MKKVYYLAFGLFLFTHTQLFPMDLSAKLTLYKQKKLGIGETIPLECQKEIAQHVITDFLGNEFCEKIKSKNSLNLENAINSILFSPCGKWVVTHTKNEAIHLWNTSPNYLLYGALVRPPDQTQQTRHDVITSFTFSQDSNYFATASAIGDIKIYHPTSGKLKHHILAKNPNYISHLVFHPTHHSILFSASYDKTAKIWDAESGMLLHTFIDPLCNGKTHDDQLNEIAINCDGTFIGTCGEDGFVKIWDYTSKKLIQKLEHTIFTGPDAVMAIIFDHKNPHLIFTKTTQACRINLWDIKNKTILKQFGYNCFDTLENCVPHKAYPLLHQERIIDIMPEALAEWSPRMISNTQSNVIATYSENKKSIEIYNALLGQHLLSIPGYTRQPMMLFSPTENLIVVAVDKTLEFVRFSNPSAKWLKKNTLPQQAALINRIDAHYKKHKNTFTIKENTDDHEIFYTLPPFLQQLLIKNYNIKIINDYTRIITKTVFSLIIIFVSINAFS